MELDDTELNGLSGSKDEGVYDSSTSGFRLPGEGLGATAADILVRGFLSRFLCCCCDSGLGLSLLTCVVSFFLSLFILIDLPFF